MSSAFPFFVPLEGIKSVIEILGVTLKICLTINSSPWSAFKGGGQLAVHHLACSLFSKGHQVHVLYSKHPHEQFNIEVPYEIHWVHHYDFATINLNIFSFSNVLGPLAEKEKFDVIHGNAEEAYWIGKIAKRNKSTYVFTSHTPRYTNYRNAKRNDETD